MSGFTGVLFKVFIALLVLFTCMPVHECAHAWVAEKLGDPTGRNQGRITLNPLAHLDLWGSVFMIISSIIGFGIGWAKPVQINPNNFKNRKVGMGITALAGPVSNFLLAFIIMIIYKIILFTIGDTSKGYYIAYVFEYMLILNIGLAVFNFLPIPPLDGSRIFSLFLPERIYFKIMQYEQFIFVILLFLLWTNLLDPVFYFLQNGSVFILDKMTFWVNLIMGAILK